MAYSRQLRDLEAAFRTKQEFIVLMSVHVAMAKSVVAQAAQHGKKVLLHADLIAGGQIRSGKFEMNRKRPF